MPCLPLPTIWRLDRLGSTAQLLNRPGIVAVLSCYIGELRTERANRAGVCVAAGYLLPGAQQAEFNSVWRQILTRHELPVRAPDGWRQLAVGAVDGRPVSDFVTAALRKDALVFIVGLPRASWSKLGSARQAYGNPRAFCFLRLMQLVLDRLEAVGETAPLSVMMPRYADGLIENAGKLAQLFEADTRAAGRVPHVGFSDPSRDCMFAAADLLIEMALERMEAAAPATNGDRPRRAGRAVNVPPLPDDAIVEVWDAAFVARHAAGLAWARPARGAKPKS